MSSFGIVIAILLSGNTGAETMSAADTYRRCYIRMVRQVPNESDALLRQVINKEKTAAAACGELFDRAQLATTGILKARTSVEAKNILRTFHDLHMSWFQSKNHGFIQRSDILRDIEEPALYFTRAALLPATSFNSVVTLKSGLQGVRDQVTWPTEYNDFQAQRAVAQIAGYPYSNLSYPVLAYSEAGVNATTGAFMASVVKPIAMPVNKLVEVGSLSGIKASNPLIIPSLRYVPSNDPDISKAIKATMTNFDGNRHFGAGIIGSQSFLANNVNLTINQVPSEYDLINRRLAARVFEDLMCHTLPTLADADVGVEVLPNSPHSFQKISSCMRCHSSIDGMAFGLRNLVVYRSAPNQDLLTQNVGWPFTGMAQLPQVAGATTFAVQPPVGRLHYRELVTGARHSDNFDSLDQLGTLIANSNDLYTCAAKRYYEFFTGVDVDLTKKATTSLDLLHQNQVLSLGTKLKTHQSIRTLLVQIFSSPAFKASDYLTEKKI